MTTTIGELANVPAPGDPVRSPWAQDATARILHRFATKAALDAQWPAATAGPGATAITLDTLTRWTSNGTAWVVVPVAALQRFAAALAGGDITGNTTQATLTIPAVSWSRVATINFASYGSIISAVVSTIFGITVDGTAVASHVTPDYAVSAAARTHELTVVRVLAADVEHTVVGTAGRQSGSGAWRYTGPTDARFNRLEVVC